MVSVSSGNTQPRQRDNVGRRRSSTTSISSLRALIAAAESRGFAAAAIRLGVSQSAISHAVATMERNLGQSLLQRTPEVLPTPFGDAVIQHAQVALQAVTAIEELASSHERRSRGAVTIAATPSVARVLLPRLSEHWRIALPSIDPIVVEGDADEVRLWLEDGTAQLAVLVDESEVSSGSIELGRDRIAALLPDDHPLADTPAIRLDELDDDPFISPRGSWGRYTSRIFDMAGLPFNPHRRVGHISSLLGMVAAGAGVGLVPTLLKHDLPPGLLLVPLRSPCVERLLILSGPRTRSMGPLAAALLSATDSTELGPLFPEDSQQSAGE